MKGAEWQAFENSVVRNSRNENRANLMLTKEAVPVRKLRGLFKRRNGRKSGEKKGNDDDPDDNGRPFLDGLRAGLREGIEEGKLCTCTEKKDTFYFFLSCF